MPEVREIFIEDDTFTIDRRRVLAICDEISRRKLVIGWDIRARVDSVDVEVLSALKRAGCERIHYGVEAGNNHILKVLRKGITIEQVEATFKVTHQVGIDTLAYFILGSPSETREDIKETVALAKRLDPDYVLFSILCPYPATELYRQGLRRNLWEGDPWQEFARHPRADFQPPIWNETFTRKELIELQEHAYKSFYARPKYVVRRLLRLRSPGELMRNARAAGRLLLDR